MKKVLYIGYYDILRDGKQVRGYSLAGAKKMDYLCSVLNDNGYYVEILSPATKSERGYGTDGIDACSKSITRQ